MEGRELGLVEMDEAGEELKDGFELELEVDCCRRRKGNEKEGRR